MPQEKKLKITLKRSVIGRPVNQKRTVEALGFKRLNQTIIQTDCAQIRGMVNKVSHLVEVVELD